MPWEIEIHPDVAEWLLGLDRRSADAIAKSLDALEIGGPTLTRPFVDTIKESRHNNMKELRSVGGHIRLLFAFDPRRVAIVVVGGDKTGNWTRWYRDNIPVADDRYDEHLQAIGAQ